MNLPPSIESYIDSLTTPRLILAACITAMCVYRTPSIRRMFGHAKTKYFHSRNSLEIPLKDGTKITFAQLVKSVLPPCKLNPFLFNGHLQTCWTAFVGDAKADVYYKRWIFENEDPAFEGTFTIDFVVGAYTGNVDESLPPRTTYYKDDEFDTLGSDDTRPMLVTLHGLSGGSHELYLREVLAKLVTEAHGWEACVVNSRGCANSKITSSVLYNARATWDVRQAVKFLRKRFPNRPLFGCGFSLGANIMTNYIGEEGENCELRAAVVLSSPWNLDAGDRALQRTWIGRNIYSRAMGTSLLRLFNQHIDQLSKNPNLDIQAIQKLKTLHEFDALVQGPSWGYPTATAYYRDASSTDSFLNIRIPFLSINAEDDPIASAESLPYEEMNETSYGVLAVTELGGHLSWFELGGGRWFAHATVAFFQKMSRDVDLKALPKASDSVSNGDASHLQAKAPQKMRLMPVFSPTRKRWHVPEN